MQHAIDTTFNVYSDTPVGKDPDSYSPTLRNYHSMLWSKPLPTGEIFALSSDFRGAYLHHASELGEFFLSSDAITHTYRNTKSLAHIFDKISKAETDEFFRLGSTIGSYTVFPSNRVNGQMTINGTRGMNSRVRDRFDLTLECIRRHYEGADSPLHDVLSRYTEFFDLFGNFRGYVDFFLFQDLVQADYAAVNFWLPFDGFNRPALPMDVHEYRSYRQRVEAFVRARNQRMAMQDVNSS